MAISSQLDGYKEEVLCKKPTISEQLILGFSEKDKEGKIQPHDDVLVVTLQIVGFNVKKVIIDHGNWDEIMYLDLFRGLGLKLEDLSNYGIPLVNFDGKVMISRGMIQLPIQTGEKAVSVNFIVVDAFSPYTAILARPWLHAMGAISSNLHVKLKYPTSEGVAELVGCQEVARQCLVVAVNHRATEVSPLETGPVF